MALLSDSNLQNPPILPLLYEKKGKNQKTNNIPSYWISQKIHINTKAKYLQKIVEFYNFKY